MECGKSWDIRPGVGYKRYNKATIILKNKKKKDVWLKFRNVVLVDTGNDASYFDCGNWE